jgi:hypothetical protein
MFGATSVIGADEEWHTILGGLVPVEILSTTKIVSAFRMSCKWIKISMMSV